MWRSLLDSWLGCSHRNTSFPFTLKKRTYIVCLDCGREFSYDWRNMRLVSEAKPKPRERTAEAV